MVFFGRGLHNQNFNHQKRIFQYNRLCNWWSLPKFSLLNRYTITGCYPHSVLSYPCNNNVMHNWECNSIPYASNCKHCHMLSHQTSISPYCIPTYKITYLSGINSEWLLVCSVLLTTPYLPILFNRLLQKEQAQSGHQIEYDQMLYRSKFSWHEQSGYSRKQTWRKKASCILDLALAHYKN